LSRKQCNLYTVTAESLPHSVRFCESLINFPETPQNILFPIGIPWRPLATHNPSASDSILDFWRFINSFTYLLTYLLNIWHKTARLVRLTESPVPTSSSWIQSAWAPTVCPV